MEKQKYILRGLLIFLAGASIISSLSNNVNYGKLSGTAKTTNSNYINIKNKPIKIITTNKLQTANGEYREIQDMAISDNYIYMSYHDLEEVKIISDKNRLKTYVSRCQRSNCNNTKEYQIFTGTGKSKQFDEYTYNNKNYIILSSNGFNKLTSKKTYRVASKDYFNISTESPNWKTLSNAYSTNDKRYNLSGKSTFKVPSDNIYSEISIDSNNKKMALKVGSNISIYSINPSNINLNKKIHSFNLLTKENKIPTYKNKEGKTVNYTPEDILLVGDYLYVAYTTNNENSDKAAYIYTYSIKTGKKIQENTRTIKFPSLKQFRLEALACYDGEIYFAASYKENNITKNKIYKITSNKYKFIGYNKNETTVYLKETKNINLTIIDDSNNKKVTVKSWKSSDSKVASVKNGNVTINNPGKVTITATLNNNQKVTFELTIRKKIIAVIGASQVSMMRDNYTENQKYGLYGIETPTYGRIKKKWNKFIKTEDKKIKEKGIFFINAGGTGINFQTGKSLEQLTAILDANYEYSEFINLYIYFPIAGNNATIFSCKNIDKNEATEQQINTLYANDLKPVYNKFNIVKKNMSKKGNFFEIYLNEYNTLISNLKTKYKGYKKFETYIVGLHPYDPLRTFETNGEIKSDINKDSTINNEYIPIVEKQRTNESDTRNQKDYTIIYKEDCEIKKCLEKKKNGECKKDKQNFSNLKYYKFNQQVKKTLENKKYKNLKYISFFETYFKNSYKIFSAKYPNKTYEEFLVRNPFPDSNYKTYDDRHWDKNTTIDYVNKLFDATLN